MVVVKLVSLVVNSDLRMDVNSEHSLKMSNSFSSPVWTDLDSKLDFVKTLTNVDLTQFLTHCYRNRKFFEKIFSHLTKNFFIFFPKFQEILENPVVSRDYRIQFFVQIYPISEFIRKVSGF